MNPYHVATTVNQDGNIVLAMPFPVGKKVEVVVMPFDDSADDKAWKELAAREFLRGYSEEDAAYDNYKL